MACGLFGAKPLFDPMLVYCQLDHWEQISVTFLSKYKIFIQENAFENGGHFVSASQCKEQG